MVGSMRPWVSITASTIWEMQGGASVGTRDEAFGGRGRVADEGGKASDWCWRYHGMEDDGGDEEGVGGLSESFSLVELAAVSQSCVLAISSSPLESVVEYHRF